MGLLKKDGLAPPHKRVGFRVSGQMYMDLLEQQREGHFPSMNALIRDRFNKKKVIVRREKYSLDKLMWSLFRWYDHFKSMDTDLRGIAAFLKMAPDEEATFTCASARIIDDQIEVLSHEVRSVLDAITKLSEKWLPE